MATHAIGCDDIVVHGFRYAISDHLKAVNCPPEMIDQNGGWSSGNISHGYGEGYSITKKKDALLGVVISVKSNSFCITL